MLLKSCFGFGLQYLCIYLSPIFHNFPLNLSASKFGHIGDKCHSSYKPFVFCYSRLDPLLDIVRCYLALRMLLHNNVCFWPFFAMQGDTNHGSIGDILMLKKNRFELSRRNL